MLIALAAGVMSLWALPVFAVPLLLAQFFGRAQLGVFVSRGSRRVRDRLHPEMLLEPLYQCSKGSLGIGALEPVSRAPDWNE